ncbi:hypothetical protein ACOMCU_15940 [Lysinibacillus sp. UGB7]|uniref:hypothetical protein n=1 Tax=Lysinibacillus sp. UGB7 TaxID=3411039 RepID=UPI003B812300
MHKQSFSNATLETQVDVVETALDAGEKVIITGKLATGKTKLLMSLKKRFNENTNKKAVYFTMNSNEVENDKSKEEFKLYGQYTDKILLIDELGSLTSCGFTLDLIHPETPIVAAIQTSSSENLNKLMEKLKLDNYFNKIIFLKEFDGDFDIFTVERDSRKVSQ